MNRTLAFVVLAPRNVCVAILSVYRAVISPLYGDVCRYYPSCSHYTLHAHHKHQHPQPKSHETRRIARCHPWAEGGVDDVPHTHHDRYAVTRFGFVVANSHGKG